MSIKLMAQVWDEADVSGSELLVLLALADHANDNGVCWPSLPRLAKRARLSDRQTQRVVQKLHAEGHIEILSRGDGRGHSTMYRVIVKGDKMTTFTEERVTSATERVTSSALKGDIAMSTESSIEPSLIQPPSSSSLPSSLGSKEDGDKAVFTAWAENIPGTMTPILAEKLHDLIDECGVPSVVHGIGAAVEAGARNLKYITACARNHAQGKEKGAKASSYKPKLTEQERGNMQSRARLAQAGLRTAEKFGGKIDPQWQHDIDKAKGAGVI